MLQINFKTETTGWSSQCVAVLRSVAPPKFAGSSVKKEKSFIIIVLEIKFERVR